MVGIVIRNITAIYILVASTSIRTIGIVIAITMAMLIMVTIIRVIIITLIL